MTKLSTKTILSIETSCDETAAAVLKVAYSKQWPAIQTLSSVIKSQIALHKSFGGVVPEVAARAHVKNILPVTKKALNDAKLKITDIDYIAVTAGPGLIPSLIVGVEFAKALSLATGKPIIPVNHMMGHLYSPLGKLGNKPVSTRRLAEAEEIKKLFPMVSLIVSGGHTMLVLMSDEKNHRVLGQTVDDAAGEAFDKVAKLLKLPYPGGPEVSKLAAKGNPGAINFPRPMMHNKNYDFSFSGLKTAVLYYVQSRKLKVESRKEKENICAAFQAAAVDVLVTKTMRAAKEFGAKSISLSGGVAANQALRESLKLKSKTLNLKFFVPPINLCTDNAEMIGLAASFMLHNGFKPKNYKTVQANSNLEI